MERSPQGRRPYGLAAMGVSRVGPIGNMTIPGGVLDQLGLSGVGFYVKVAVKNGKIVLEPVQFSTVPVPIKPAKVKDNRRTKA